MITENDTICNIQVNSAQYDFLTSEKTNTGLVAGLGCIPHDTEVRIKDKWIKISDYNGEDILIYDKNTDNTYYSKPSRYIKEKLDYFVEYKTSQFKMTISPEHNILYTTEHSNKWQESKQKDLSTNRILIPSIENKKAYDLRNATTRIIKDQEYKYCFTTETGFFIARENGRVFITGNSGKTFIATIKTILKKLEEPTLPVAYYLPNYTLIRDIAFVQFSEILEEQKIPYVLNKTSKEIHIAGKSKILFRSMDTPETIVGYEVYYSLIDECDILPLPKMTIAYQKIKARNRAKGKKANCIDVVGTPEGFKWFYKRYVTEFNYDLDLLCKARTKDNKFLPDGYIDELKREFPSQLIEAYLNGEFVNLTQGAVYTQYDVNMNDTDKEDNGYSELHIGIDFNVSAMSGVVCIFMEDKIYAIDELIGLFDTPSLIAEIKDRYRNRQIVVYPDSAGNQRKSVGADETDIKLLTQAGFKVRANNVNPPIMTRVNTLNASFCNSVGDRTLYINRSKCKDLDGALQKQVYDEKTNKPDKTSGYDNQGIDGIGYLICYAKPMQHRIARYNRQATSTKTTIGRGYR